MMNRTIIKLSLFLFLLPMVGKSQAVADLIDIAQNNKSNKSVDIKKEDRLAAGIIRKLKAHNFAFFSSNDKFKQSL